MTTLSARQLDWRARWHPRVAADDCTHPAPAFYLDAGPDHVARRCRSCGAQLAAVEPRCVRLLDIGRRCFAPARYGGLCRAHAR